MKAHTKEQHDNVYTPKHDNVYTPIHWLRYFKHVIRMCVFPFRIQRRTSITQLIMHRAQLFTHAFTMYRVIPADLRTAAWMQVSRCSATQSGLLRIRPARPSSVTGSRGRTLLLQSSRRNGFCALFGRPRIIAATERRAGTGVKWGGIRLIVLHTAEL